MTISNEQVLSQVGIVLQRTTSEIAAGVTPVNYGYQAGNVLRYGADLTGATDSSTAFNNAGKVSTRLYVPAGTYKINATLSNKVIMYGEGSTLSILSPTNTSLAAILYKSENGQWDYHTEIHGIGFTGTGTQTTAAGIGIAFGQSIFANYISGDELANNVRFIGCRFTNLLRGVQLSYGNIGCEFYSCGWTGNYYGVYALNNKFGTDSMQVGNYYFFGGEMDNNVCAFYGNNNSASVDFGAIEFSGTILEQNTIAFYMYGYPDALVPVQFNGCWFELNGQIGGIRPSTAVVDTWSGTTNGTQTIASYTIYLDGTAGAYIFNKSLISNVAIPNSGVTCVMNDCRVEFTAGYGGGPNTVDNGSQIELRNCYTGGGGALGQNVTVSGYLRTTLNTQIDGNASTSSGRPFQIQHRSAKGWSRSGDLAVSFITPQATAGAFSLTGTLTQDGIIFPQCNQWTIDYTSSNQYDFVTATTTSTFDQWYVCTFDVKLISGSVGFFVWDANTAQLMTFYYPPQLGRWYTVAAYGSSPGGQSLALSFGFPQSLGVAQFNLSAYQIHRFDNQQEVLDFLSSQSYLQPTNASSISTTPGSISNNTSVSSTITVSGANIGDTVTLSYTGNLNGAFLTGSVTAANTVTAYFNNNTGSSVTPGNGQITAVTYTP